MLLSGGCLNPACENEIREELVSPDGNNKVVIFSRNCGATTGFNCQASILPVGDRLPEDGGNAFVVDKGGAKVWWVDSSTLAVSVEGSARVCKQEGLIRGVKLVYSIVRDGQSPGEKQAPAE